MTEQKTQTAAQKVQLVAFLGVMVTLIGLALAGLQVPHTEYANFSGDPVERGDAVLFFVGLAVSAVGSLLLSVAVVAWGVALGSRMTRDE